MFAGLVSSLVPKYFICLYAVIRVEAGETCLVHIYHVFRGHRHRSYPYKVQYRPYIRAIRLVTIKLTACQMEVLA